MLSGKELFAHNMDFHCEASLGECQDYTVM